MHKTHKTTQHNTTRKSLPPESRWCYIAFGARTNPVVLSRHLPVAKQMHTYRTKKKNTADLPSTIFLRPLAHHTHPPLAQAPCPLPTSAPARRRRCPQESVPTRLLLPPATHLAGFRSAYAALARVIDSAVPIPESPNFFDLSNLSTGNTGTR